MAYTINLTDGTIFATVEDGTVDNSSSISLVGKNVASYGELLDENYMRLLESHATVEAGIPPAPLTGQVWFDKTASTLKVFDGSVFKNLGSATPAGTEPPGAESIVGDIWFNTTTEQTYIYNSTDYVLIGTTTPLGSNPSDPVVTIITDNGAADHVVVEYYVDGTRVAITSADAEFVPAPAEPGFAVIKPGYNLSTDIAGAVFNGTATNAESLGDVLASNFLRTDIDSITFGKITFEQSAPTIDMTETGVTAGNKNWRIQADAEQFMIRSFDDAWSTNSQAITIRRTGAVIDEVEMQHPTTQHSPTLPEHLTRLDYVENNYLPFTGGDLTGHLSFTDNKEVQLGNSTDFKMAHYAGSTLLSNSTGTFGIVNNVDDVNISSAVANGTVWVAGNAGITCAGFGQGDSRATLYWGGSSKLNTLIDGVSVTGNLTISNTTPAEDYHLASKGYVDSRIEVPDYHPALSVSINTGSGGSWASVFVNANAKYALITASVYGIFDTGGGHVRIYAKDPDYVAAPNQTGLIVTSISSSSGDAGSGAAGVISGSEIVKCDATGSIDVYGLRSSATVIAPSGFVTIKGWIE